MGEQECSERKTAMRQELERALELVQQGAVAETAKAVERIKALPKDEQGVFDLSDMEDAAEIKRLLYPVYAAYETDCNKKEGYPDIMEQMRILDARLQADYDMQEAAVYMDMSLRTLMYMSQEIYECYRELMDLYKKNVHRFVQEFYGEGKIQPGAVPTSPAEVLFVGNLMLACKNYVLLAEKYEIYYEFMNAGRTDCAEKE